MITVECHAGVLIELRFEGMLTLEEVARSKSETVALLTRLAAEHTRRAVICTDLRAIRMFSPEATNEIIDLMRSGNPRIERNAVFGSESALLTLQVQRLLLEAGVLGRRRIFTRLAPLVAWIGEVLLEDERARLLEFLEPSQARGTENG
jgi:hypothetical protein